MLIAAIVERLIKTVSVEVTNSDRWDFDFLIDLIDSAAAWAKQEKFKKEKDCPEQWLYTYTLPYDANIQDDECVTQYKLPPFLTLPYGFNGLTSVTGTKGKPITIYAGSNTFHNTQLHPFFKNDACAYIDGDRLKTTNIQLGSVKVKGLFTQILSNPNFNPDYDNYPVSEDLLWLMGTYIINQYLNSASVRVVPAVNSGSPQNQQPAPQTSPQPNR